MGTRSKTSFYKRDYNKAVKIDTHIVSVYQQFDGYLSGVGQQILDFLNGGELGNGIAGRPELGKFFNGIDCMAASFIAIEKTNPGGLYITEEDSDQEYNYNVISDGDDIWIGYEGKEYTLDEFEKLIDKVEY